MMVFSGTPVSSIFAEKNAQSWLRRNILLDRYEISQKEFFPTPMKSLSEDLLEFRNGKTVTQVKVARNGDTLKATSITASTDRPDLAITRELQTNMSNADIPWYFRAPLVNTIVPKAPSLTRERPTLNRDMGNRSVLTRSPHQLYGPAQEEDTLEARPISFQQGSSDQPGQSLSTGLMRRRATRPATTSASSQLARSANQPFGVVQDTDTLPVEKRSSGRRSPKPD